MPVPPPEPRTLELRDYLRVIRRRKWVVLFTVVLSVGVALAASFLREPVYTAEAKLLLAPFTSGVSGGGANASSRSIDTEIQVMGSPPILEATAENLGRGVGSIGFARNGETEVVSIICKNENAKEAARTCNVYSETYIEERRAQIILELGESSDQIRAEIATIDTRLAEIEAQIGPVPEDRNATGSPLEEERSRLLGQRAQYQVQLDGLSVGERTAQQGGAQVLAQAGVPSSPTNQTPIRNAVAGFGVGLVLGIALAFLREYLDDSVKSKEDLEETTRVTTLGLIPSMPEWKDRRATPLVAMAEPRSPVVEAYRTLRTSIEFLSLDQPIRSLQVTSATAAEGKTTTLANLATMSARAGKRVIVLCCDLRRPRVHEFFHLDNTVGFTSVLLGETQISDAIQRVPGDLPLGLVASGPMPPNPAELLASRRAADVMEGLEDRCDLLLVDSPPVVPVADALVIAGLVDAVLLVADSGGTTKRGLGRAVELLRQIEAPVIGSVLNSVRSPAESYTYASEYYYTHRELAGARTNGRPRRKVRTPT